MPRSRVKRLLTRQLSWTYNSRLLKIQSPLTRAVAFRVGVDHAEQRVGEAVAAIDRVGRGAAEVESAARIRAAHLELLGVLDSRRPL